MTHASADAETIEQGNVLPERPSLAEHVEYWRERARRAEKREERWKRYAAGQRMRAEMLRAIAEAGVELLSEAAPDAGEEW